MLFQGWGYSLFRKAHLGLPLEIPNRVGNFMQLFTKTRHISGLLELRHNNSGEILEVGRWRRGWGIL